MPATPTNWIGMLLSFSTGFWFVGMIARFFLGHNTQSFYNAAAFLVSAIVLLHFFHH